MAGPGALTAQARSEAAGTVVRAVDGDTVGVPGVLVVLHRVGPAAQGPVDSVRTGPLGRFAFRFVPDTAAAYIVSTTYRGLAYFSDPLGAAGTEGRRLLILVSDTSSTAPVVLEARYLLVGGPEAESGRSILDVFVLRNPGPLTRVAGGPDDSTWSVALPAGAETTVEEGTEVSREAIRITDGRLVLSAPLAPGRRQLVLSHQVPLTTRTFRVPVGVDTEGITVLAEETGTGVRGGGLAEVEPQVVQDRAVRRWTGPAAGADTVVLSLAAPAPGAGGLLLAMVVLAGAGFAAAGMLVWRRRTGRPAAARPSPLDELAILDARYLGREAEVTAEEWAAYQARRATLKRQLGDALAARERRS